MYTELPVFSAYLLLSAYYLTVYIYRRMRLTTCVYSMVFIDPRALSSIQVQRGCYSSGPSGFLDSMYNYYL